MNHEQPNHRASGHLARRLAPLFRPPRRVLLTPTAACLLEETLDDRPTATATVATALPASFGRLLAEQGHARIDLVLSDTWVRYCAIKVDAAPTLSQAELLALGRGQLAREHPDAAAWPMRCALHGNTLLASAIPPKLLDEIHATAAAAHVRLTRIEPLFANIWQCCGHDNGWLLLDQPDLLTVAFIQSGRLVALHSARRRADEAFAASAQKLLERQSALLAIAPGDVCLCTRTSQALDLAPPWRLARRFRY